jgi:hypothetical protein
MPKKNAAAATAAYASRKLPAISPPKWSLPGYVAVWPTLSTAVMYAVTPHEQLRPQGVRPEKQVSEAEHGKMQKIWSGCCGCKCACSKECDVEWSLANSRLPKAVDKKAAKPGREGGQQELRNGVVGVAVRARTICE